MVTLCYSFDLPLSFSFVLLFNISLQSFCLRISSNYVYFSLHGHLMFGCVCLKSHQHTNSREEKRRERRKNWYGWSLIRLKTRNQFSSLCSHLFYTYFVQLLRLIVVFHLETHLFWVVHSFFDSCFVCFFFSFLIIANNSCCLNKHVANGIWLPYPSSV